MPVNKMKIEVVDHNPGWTREFGSIKEVISGKLTASIKGIEHFGSTSVSGLAAKPILDIDIIIEDDLELQKKVITQLAQLGYKHQGDLGITGREAFRRESEYVPFNVNKRVWQKHNLYLCRAGSLGLRNHLAFRDFLKENPEKCIEYSKLKKELAARFPDDIDSYIDGKTDFIVDVLNKSGLTERDSKVISDENRMK